MSEYLQTVFEKFELRVRKGYYYTEDGLWASVEGTKVRVGVTDYLQRTGGDVAFVELVKLGSTVQKQTEIGTLETAKTTVSLLSPISGTVEEVNGMLSEKPELVNSDLRPVIKIKVKADSVDRVAKALDWARKYSLVANSIKPSVSIEPKIETEP